MAKKHQYVKKNIAVLRKLVKTGDISCKLINDFQIYEAYQSYKKIPSKMERYGFVAEDLGISNQVVMRAVKNMESNM